MLPPSSNPFGSLYFITPHLSAYSKDLYRISKFETYNELKMLKTSYTIELIIVILKWEDVHDCIFVTDSLARHQNYEALPYMTETKNVSQRLVLR